MLGDEEITAATTTKKTKGKTESKRMDHKIETHGSKAETSSILPAFFFRSR